MERLAGGEQPEPRPQPVNQPQTAGPGGQYPPPYPPQAPRGRRAPQPMPPQPPRDPRDRDPRDRDPRDRDPRDPRAPESSAYGPLSVRVQPGPAEILVDGERWRGPEGQERVFVELPEGRHTVEIQKSGFRTYVTEVDIRRGETTPLNVSLRNQEDR
jgi:hypothetical protein